MNNKEVRSLVFTGVAAMVVAGIFLTPIGLIWYVTAVIGWTFAEFSSIQPINFFLWLALWLLVTIMFVWYIFINKHGLPEKFFTSIERRIEGRKNGTRW
jgi:glucan phosphoethanolaminetransferase (alkaline phosphatase superfamily)